jgi:hypothetical protein
MDDAEFKKRAKELFAESFDKCMDKILKQEAEIKALKLCVGTMISWQVADHGVAGAAQLVRMLEDSDNGSEQER